LEHRADDHEEVVRKRLDTYEAMTAELLPFYAELGILKRVNGMGSMAEVTARVLGALGSK
jgi:adenylate kinase